MSIAVAKALNCEIVNADSRQVYREMSIGTAKPSVEELHSVPHHLIGHRSIEEDYSVAKYEEDALQILAKLHQSQRFAIAVGGTGFYLNALKKGIDEFPAVTNEIKDKYNKVFETEGIEVLQAALELKDPRYYEAVDQNNPHRLIRALSVIEASGGSAFSSFLIGKEHERPFVTHSFAIQMDRKLLYERINQRVDIMIEDGLIDEARMLYPKRHLKSLNTVGYKELFDHFDGNVSLEYAIDKIKQHSRNYAKRQVTWFKNQGDFIPISNDTGVQEIISNLDNDS